jgi:hypothetical protein
MPRYDACRGSSSFFPVDTGGLLQRGARLLLLPLPSFSSLLFFLLL